MSLRRALMHLYDPSELRHSPLLKWLGIENSSDRVGTLRRIIHLAIQQMNPQQRLQGGSTPRQMVDILTYRFIEQLSQKEVASDFAISLRQVQRLEAKALRSMAEMLATQHNLELDWSGESEIEKKPAQAEDTLAEEKQPSSFLTENNQVLQELDWLKQTYQVERINLALLLQSVIEKAQPVLEQQSIHLCIDPIDPDIVISGQSTILCQALLSIMSRFALTLPGGVLHITVQNHQNQVVLYIRTADCIEGIQKDEVEFDIARKLLNLCGGGLEWQETSNQAICGISVVLMSAQPSLVLVIDDNQDTLLLLERYLTDSHYQFMATRQPEHAFTLIQKVQPKVIVLDVMLPGIDGWEFLSRIKRNPEIRHIPVVVSTILPQQRLAMMLGAEAFLQKPFTREKFLLTLDDLLAGSGRESSGELR